MLVDLGVVEQRHEAVLEVLGGVSVLAVARRYGVSRQSVHRWLRRYARWGIAGLADRSHRPATCPHRMAPAIEARIVELRLEHPSWGPRTLRHRLGLEGAAPLPGRSSIYRCLVRHSLIEPQRRRRKREDYRRWERSRAMELWQMDVMGMKLADGREVKIVTALDDHSRFCVCAAIVPRATARPVCEALIAAMATHGIPEQLLTDNGKVFTARFGRGRGEVLFDRLLREYGVRHLLTAPHAPTTTGKVERFHKTIRSEFLAGRTFTSLQEAQAALDAWVAHYNAERPHQSLGMSPPAKRFALAAPEPAPALVLAEALPDEAEHESRTLTRLVSRQGRISLANTAYHVGTWLAGETVEVVLRDDGLLDILHRGVLVASHARRHRLKAEPLLPQKPRRRPNRAVAGPAVKRMVDCSGSVSFAGTTYRVGNLYRRQQVEVRLRGDEVEILREGKLLRSHRARHDRAKEHGAFATPAGRPRKLSAAQEQELKAVTQLPEPLCNAGGGP